MNITSKQQVMIFKREYQGNVFYSLGLSKKNREGTYINGYMPCQFKKEVQLEHKTIISIKNAWLSFYLKEKVTYPYIFISEFEIVNETSSKMEQVKENQEDNPFSGIEIDDDDLPF